MESNTDSVLIAVQAEKIKNLENKLHTTDARLQALEKDRESALKWGLILLGSTVLSMGAWIFKYITKTVS